MGAATPPVTRGELKLEELRPRMTVLVLFFDLNNFSTKDPRGYASKICYISSVTEDPVVGPIVDFSDFTGDMCRCQFVSESCPEDLPMTFSSGFGFGGQETFTRATVRHPRWTFANGTEGPGQGEVLRDVPVDQVLGLEDRDYNEEGEKA